MHPTIAQIKKVNKAFHKFAHDMDQFLKVCRENGSPIEKIRVQVEPEQNYRRITLTYEKGL